MGGHQLPGLACPDSVDIGVAGPMAWQCPRPALAWTSSPVRRADSARTAGSPAMVRPRAAHRPAAFIAVLTDDPHARVDNTIVHRLH
jgi:hypothetical protein